MIAVAGCVAQAEGAEIPRGAPSVDIDVGPQAYHRLPELVAKAAAARRRSTPTCRSVQVSASCGPPPKRASAFLTVQEGCDSSAPIASVPYTRGAEVSRGWSAILDEARALVDGGAREITCSARM
jgi:tRNA-2-methylthio-N6-dimethylallyladenosine synthase